MQKLFRGPNVGMNNISSQASIHQPDQPTEMTEGAFSVSPLPHQEKHADPRSPNEWVRKINTKLHGTHLRGALQISTCWTPFFDFSLGLKKPVPSTDLQGFLRPHKATDWFPSVLMRQGSVDPAGSEFSRFFIGPETGQGCWLPDQLK